MENRLAYIISLVKMARLNTIQFVSDENGKISTYIMLNNKLKKLNYENGDDELIRFLEYKADLDTTLFDEPQVAELLFKYKDKVTTLLLNVTNARTNSQMFVELK